MRNDRQWISHYFARWTAAAALVCATACTSSAPLWHAPEPLPVSRGSSPRSSSVRGGELDALGAPSLFDALARLRPEYLRGRRQSSADAQWTYADVYLDGRPFGDLSALTRLSTNGVTQVRYLSATEAFFLLGRSHPGGTIYVSTR